MRILSIDPGSRWVAIVVRDMGGHDDDEALVDWTVLDREDLDRPDLATWVRHVATVATNLRIRHGPDEIAVEAVVAPGGHASGRKGHIIAPGPIIETAAVLGGIVTAFTSAHVIPAGDYGPTMPNRRILVAAYPSDLVGPRETTGSGKSPHQHARAAWDMATAAAPKIRATRR